MCHSVHTSCLVIKWMAHTFMLRHSKESHCLFQLVGWFWLLVVLLCLDLASFIIYSQLHCWFTTMGTQQTRQSPVRHTNSWGDFRVKVDRLLHILYFIFNFTDKNHLKNWVDIFIGCLMTESGLWPGIRTLGPLCHVKTSLWGKICR